MDDVKMLVAPGEMGEQHIKGFNVPFAVVGEIGQQTSAGDTKRISREMVDRGVKLLVFVGGDGTARDVCDAIDSTVPVVGVPAGVKAFSSVFALIAKAISEGQALVKTLPEYRGAFHQLYRRIARLVTGWERKGVQ